MKKISELFTVEELTYLSEKRPDLIPMDLPEISDVDTLNLPSLDQMIIEFLKQYEVYVEPRSVGKWNGWDVLSTLSLLSGIYSNANNDNTVNAIQGGAFNIASGLFFANRSNQINNAAQDWNTWKRWTLDHKDFEQFNQQIIQAVEQYNKQIIYEIENKINQVERNNRKVTLALEESIAKEFISKLIEKERIYKESEDQAFYDFLKNFLLIPCLIGLIILIIYPFFNTNLPQRKRQSNLHNVLVKEFVILHSS